MTRGGKQLAIVFTDRSFILCECSITGTEEASILFSGPFLADELNNTYSAIAS